MTLFWVDNTGKLDRATDDSQDLSPLIKVTIAPQSGVEIWDAITETWVVYLNTYKANKIKLNQIEAGKRIASLFNTNYGTDQLRDRQFNALVRYIELREKEVDATLTVQELTEISALKAKKDLIKSIRNSENTAARSIDAAIDKVAVDAVIVSWP